MSILARVAQLTRSLLESNGAFYLSLGLFVLGAIWIAAASIYPMAFDEEFHLGLIKIYASSLVPFGIEHTSGMAQYGAATADASYLFHYLMSFPYRFLTALSIPSDAVIIILRLLNIAFVTAGLVVFRRALLEAGISRSTVTIGIVLVASIPIFPLLAAHINYDNLLFLIFAWCVLLIVRLTNKVRAGQALLLVESIHLAAAVLLGMSVKYAFLPFALAMFIWVVWLMIIGYKRHKQTISSQIRAYKKGWKSLIRHQRYMLILLAVISTFFASHYLTNMLTYGSPIPSCERVFSETECQAYGPWARNKSLEATKSESFVALSYPSYMATEWFPGMSQRLTFAVAGKTNDFETKLPLPALERTFVTLFGIGLVCLIIQIARRKTGWLTAFTSLLTFIYVGILSLQLYGDYIDTSEPVAINGRYLLPLLPLIAVVLIVAVRRTFNVIDARILSVVALLLFALLALCGAGVSTYVVLAESHWLWPGFGQSSHTVLQDLFERVILPYRQTF